MKYRLTTVFLLLTIAVSSVLLSVEAQESTREICDANICHVSITSDGFLPKTLIVRVGTTVVWTNNDDGRHTVTSGSPGEVAAPLKSLLLEKDGTYEFTFDAASSFGDGRYNYFDQVTKTMRGEIIVGAAEPTPPTIEEPEVQTIKIDFRNPESGVKSVSLSNGEVKDMGINPDSYSLIMTVETEETNGMMDIVLDRNLIDAKDKNKDNDFKVLINGEEGFYEETASTPDERTLQIVVPGRTSEIEIVGTQVVPHIMRANAAISDAETVIEDQKSNGIVLGSAENKLAMANDAFDNGEYSAAETLANDAKTLAIKASEDASVANEAMNEASAVITDIIEQGFPVSGAQEVFDQAGEEYTKGNYNEALSLAQQAMSEARQAKTIAMEANKEANGVTADSNSSGQVYIITSIIAVSAAGAAGAFAYLRTRKIHAKESIANVPAGELFLKEKRVIDLNKIASHKSHMRDYDKDVIIYIAENGGEVFE
ncbi:MAG: cupredoxin domain-containing protein, partial [Nitrososphaerales archaeon]